MPAGVLARPRRTIVGSNTYAYRKTHESCTYHVMELFQYNVLPYIRINLPCAPYDNEYKYFLASSCTAFSMICKFFCLCRNVKLTQLNVITNTTTPNLYVIFDADFWLHYISQSLSFISMSFIHLRIWILNDKRRIIDCWVKYYNRRPLLITSLHSSVG